MGVKGLWSLLEPTSRPIKLESLTNLKVAIDASIWLHQFTAAMRDQQGAMLPNAHIIGFFRRICKLLFLGIQPVFVYDGSVPELKRRTVEGRVSRKAQVKDKLRKTAEKLLEARLKLTLLQNEGSLDEDQHHEALIAILRKSLMDESERQANSQTDAFDLPHSLLQKPTQGLYDQRIITQDEMHWFVSQHKHDVDLGLVNVDSEAFHALPIEKQHDLIIELKNRARAPNKARVESMLRRAALVADSVDPVAAEAFSKEQIKNLVHRNTITQRISSLARNAGVVKNPTADSVTANWKRRRVVDARRVAGVRDREFVLVKNDDIGPNSTGFGVGGWTMTSREPSKKRVVESITGMEGFADSNTVNNNKPGVGTAKFEGDYMLEDESIEQVMARFEHAEKLQTKQVIEPVKSPASADYNTNGIDSILYNTHNSNREYSHDVRLLDEAVSDSESISCIMSRFEELEDRKTESQHLQHQNNSEHTLPRHSASDDAEFVLHWVSSWPVPIDISHQKAHVPLDKSILDTPISELQREQDQFVKLRGKAGVGSDAEVSHGFMVKFLDAVIERKETSTEVVPSVIGEYVKDNENTQEVESNHLIDDVNNRDKRPIKSLSEFFVLDDDSGSQMGHDTVDSTIYEEKHDVVAVEPASKDVIVIPDETDATDDNDASDDEQWEKVEPDILQQTQIGEAIAVTTTTPVNIEANNDVMEMESDDPVMSLTQEEQEMIQDLIHEAEADTHEAVPSITEQQEQSSFETFFTSMKQNELKAVSSDQLIGEITELEKQRRRELRDAGDLTHGMFTDTQELLTLFGIPFIVAPTEAEAQCAFLVDHYLVDAIITDDSDVFLFGGTRVLKNMFNDSKYVEQYTMRDIEIQTRLDRDRMVQLAMLVGSDYTNGVVGVGPVKAVKIIQAFEGPKLEGLKVFKEWVNNLQLGVTDEEDSEERKKMRKLAKSLDLSDSFPDMRVYDAYTKPVVDEDLAPFVLGVPHVEGIRMFIRDKLGWDIEKINAVLVPVIKRMNERKVNGRQTTLDQHFPSGNNSLSPKKPHKSKALRTVFSKWKNETDGNDDTSDTPKKKRKTTSSDTPKKKRKTTSSDTPKRKKK